MSLEELMLDTRIWRGKEGRFSSPVIPTGFGDLDRYLPAGGWPNGAITELALDHYGIGELKLLIPALIHLSRRDAKNKKWMVWVAPPFVPYAPALQQQGIDLDCLLIVHLRETQGNCLWAVEQAIRSGSSAAVLAWVQAADDTDLRRLQLAAEERCCWVVLFRPVAALQERSPATLRMRLHRNESATLLEIIKCRGRPPAMLTLEPISKSMRAEKPRPMGGEEHTR